MNFLRSSWFSETQALIYINGMLLLPGEAQLVDHQDGGVVPPGRVGVLCNPVQVGEVKSVQVLWFGRDGALISRMIHRICWTQTRAVANGIIFLLEYPT